MKKNNIGYLIREGIRSVFVKSFVSFAAICVTVACLIIMGSFGLIMLNLQQMVSDLEQENEIMAYIDESYSTARAKSVGSQINLISNVHEAKYISREQALENFVSKQNDSALFDGIDSTTLRDRYVITLEDNSLIQQTVGRIEGIEGVAEVVAHYEISSGFQTVQRMLNVASLVIILVLFVASTFIISNTVKLAMHSRREEIEIMKMVGATNSFIRFPFVIEGFILGILGAVIAFFVEWGIYDFLSVRVAEFDTLQLIRIIPFREVLELVAIGYAIAGFIIGVFGSVLSIRKFLKA